MTRVKAFAPATAANLAVGYDLLGLSLDVAGDIVTVEKNSSGKVVIETLDGVEKDLPRDPKNNSATAGLARMIEELDLPFGFNVAIQKGIPLGSGMGGSAASAVASVVAVNALLDKPLSKDQLLSYALVGERVATGTAHADNVAPCLLGGLTLAKILDPGDETRLPSAETLSLPLPDGLHCVLIRPHLRIDTREARKILKNDISLESHVLQSGHLAGFVASCFRNDVDLMKKSLTDVLIEPQRSRLIPGFEDVKRAALREGAIGCSISGSGPSLFALAQNRSTADRILNSMTEVFLKNDIETDTYLVALPCQGARILS